MPGAVLLVPARGGQRGGSGRGPDGRAHPAGRAAQGGGRHAGPGGGRVPGREPDPGADRGGGRAGGRMAGRPAAHQTRCRPGRRPGRPIAHAAHGRGGAWAWRSAVALASTLVPAIRAARTSTVSALADSARPPRRRGALISAVRPGCRCRLLFGLRMAARRPRRALLSAASIAVTVAGIVAVLAFHATVNAERTTIGGSSGGLANPVVSRDEQMLTGDHDRAGHPGRPSTRSAPPGRRCWTPGTPSALVRALGARPAAGQRRAGWRRRCCPRCRAPSWASRWASGCSRPSARGPDHPARRAMAGRHGARHPARGGRAGHHPGPDRRPHPGGADPPVRDGVIPARRPGGGAA